MSSVDALLDRARHRLEFRFIGAVSRDLFNGIPGVVDAEVEDHTALVTIDGPEGPALRAAADAGLLRVSPVGDDLEDLFLSLYQTKDVH